jgi:ParB family chromosome partitioning protein
MAEFKTIAINDIIVPERLRAVEEDHALAIQASIVEHGLINPITVRRTPPATKPFKPYTLVTGAHRRRAVELNGEPTIEAMVVEADKVDALLLEITENLIRNELSALDRAVFVNTYRAEWESKYGKVAKGRPGNSVNITELIAEEAKAGFSAHTAERLGLSVSAIEKAQFIGKALSPDLRRRLRGTPVADNQSQLIKLAKLQPERQANVARALDLGHDVPAALEHTDPDAKAKAEVSEQDVLFSRLVSTWSRTDEKTRARFLEHAGAQLRAKRERLPKLAELIAATDQPADDPNQITIFEAIEARS